MSSSSASMSSRSPSPATSVEEPFVEVKQTKQAKDWRPKSTFHRKARKDMTWMEKLVMRGEMSDAYHTMKPDADRGPVPAHSTFGEHVWILPRALAAQALQQVSYWIFPNYKWPVWLAFPIYLICLAEFALASLKRFDKYALVYGTLDEKNCSRDRIPDNAVQQLAIGFLSFMIARNSGEFILKWDSSESPINAFSWTTPVRMFLWLITLDYFFYVYHRSCHEIDFLWHIHQKHHSTKHPSPVLSILADGYQECLEIALIPLCATLLIPMNFHELQLMVCYCAYVEIFGHTGIRADWSLPITGPVLRWIGMELLIEDHDLHHRYGKGGRNYGKQSRVWDVVFGTTTPREEMKGMKGHYE